MSEGRQAWQPAPIDRTQKRLSFWLVTAAAVGSALMWAVAEVNGLNTGWDKVGVPVLVAIYAVVAYLIQRHPQRCEPAMLAALIAASVFCLGAMFIAATSHSELDWLSLASTSQFMPLLYVAAFVTLQQGAARFSWAHYAGLVGLFAYAKLSPTVGHAPNEMATHLWVSTLTSNPVYIIALHYITALKGRLGRRELEHHQSKERFLAMLSHEIRSPLQAMLGSIDLLAIKARPGPERRAVDRLRESAAQLDAHLRDVTEYTRLENPAWQLRSEAVDLLALGQDLMDQLQPQAEARGLQLSLDAPARGAGPSADWALIQTDGRRLRQVLANLLGNALKYTPSGHITLKLIPPEAHNPLRIEVSDTGIGIAEADLARIFEPYVRLEDRRVAHEEGSGLGLAVVRLLSERLGLTLSIDSRADQGTTFELRWPQR